MPIINTENLLLELKEAFSDIINYESDDPLEPINPLTYHTPEGDSCLHLATIRGNFRAVELLLEAGLDVNQAGDMGNTPLHYAYKFGHDDIVHLLIENGALTDIVNEFGDTPR